MIYNYFLKYYLEVADEKSESHFSHFEKLSDVIISLFINRIEQKKINFKNERLYFINLIAQKFLLHVFSIKKLVEGIELESKSKGFITSTTDPFSVHSLTRVLIESYLVQNYLSNRLEDEDILDGRFDIWMRYGLRHRGIEPETKEEHKVTEADKNSIEILEENIKKRKFFLELSETKKETFLKQINKRWKFIFDGEDFRPVSWKELIKLTGIKEGTNNNVYNFLSWHSHSGSISILQLKNMWDEDFDKVSIKVSINKINMFIGFLVSDIVYSDEEFKNSFNKLSHDLKDVVNFYNISNRGEKYCI